METDEQRAERLKELSWEIVNKVREISIAADNTHLVKRQNLKRDLFARVPADEIASVRTYVNQFMNVMAARSRRPNQSNARLFVGNGRTQKHAEVTE